MFEIHMRSTIGLLILFVISFGTNSCQKEFSIDAVDSSLLTPPPTSSVTGSFTATCTINTSTLTNGSYVLQITDPLTHKYFQRLITKY